MLETLHDDDENPVHFDHSNDYGSMNIPTKKSREQSDRPYGRKGSGYLETADFQNAIMALRLAAKFRCVFKKETPHLPQMVAN